MRPPSFIEAVNLLVSVLLLPKTASRMLLQPLDKGPHIFRSGGKS